MCEFPCVTVRGHYSKVTLKCNSDQTKCRCSCSCPHQVSPGQEFTQEWSYNSFRMLESVDQNKLWRYKQRYHDISKSQIDQQTVYRCPRNKGVFFILLQSFKFLSVSKLHMSQITFSNPKIKQWNTTYLPSFQRDIETILQLVLKVFRTNASLTIQIYIWSFRGNL